MADTTRRGGVCDHHGLRRCVSSIPRGKVERYRHVYPCVIRRLYAVAVSVALVVSEWCQVRVLFAELRRFYLSW